MNKIAEMFAVTNDGRLVLMRLATINPGPGSTEYRFEWMATEPCSVVGYLTIWEDGTMKAGPQKPGIATLSNGDTLNLTYTVTF